jgi:hypothetical protein
MELSPDGYEQITTKIQGIEVALNEGFFELDAALRHLRTASGELHELRHILNDVCLLVPDTAEPPGPGAA